MPQGTKKTMKRLDRQNLKDLIKAELGLYKLEFEKNNYNLVFGLVEKVCMISQSFPWIHTIIYLKIVQFAALTFMPIQMIVQSIYSLFSVKSSTFGIFPARNADRANVIFKDKMTI